MYYRVHRQTKYLQVKGIEEENQVFALVVLQLDILKLTVHHSRSLKVGSWLLHESRQESVLGGQLSSARATQQILSRHRGDAL